MEIFNVDTLGFDARMRAVHDNLYASANIRVPEDLQMEVAKAIQALTWMSMMEVVPLVPSRSASEILAGDRRASAPVARDVRAAFSAYNKMMRRYPPRETLALDDASLAYIRVSLQDVDMSDAERDWLGDALEVFRSTAAKRLGGQFFTDQQVTTLALEMLEFDADTHDLVDMCAGTGGFLLAGARMARQSGGSVSPTLVGVDVDSSLASLANTTIHQAVSIGAGDVVFNADALQPPEHWPLALRKRLVPGTHLRLATNPPFGQKITIKDKSLLSRFDLGHVWTRGAKEWFKNRRVSPTPPDILFVERNLQLAAPGEGRVAIVVPYQVLSGPKLGYVRQWILRHARVLAVVDLPDVAFQPWTGTKTAILVVERRATPLLDDEWLNENYPIFMAVSRKIGHDRRGNPILGPDGRRDSDLPEIAARFHDHRAGGTRPPHELGFVISSASLTWDSDLRLNAAYHDPAKTTAHGAVSRNSVVTLGDVTSRIFFPGRFKRNYVGPDGVLFLGGTNITQLSPTNRKYLSPSDPRLDQLRVREGWILVTRSGSTGIVSSVPKSWDGVAMSEHVIRIVPDEEKLPGELIEVFLNSKLGQSLLARGVFGSVIDEITPEHVASLPLPPIDVELAGELTRLKRAANDAREQAMSLGADADRLFEEFVGRKLTAIRQDSDICLTLQDVVHQGEKFIES